MALKKLIGELHRRSIWQVLAAYAVFTWLLFETFEVLRVAVGLPDWVEPTAAVILVVLLPALLATASIQKGKPARWPRFASSPDAPDEAPTPVSPVEPPAAETVTEAVELEPTVAPAAARPRRRVGAGDLLTWRNTLLGGVGAFGLLAIFTAAYMILRTLGIGPAGTLVAQGTLDERERLILADFASPADLDEVARAITEGVRFDLTQSEVVRLHDQRYVSAALDRMELEPDAQLDLELAREVALRESIRGVVGGEIRRVGSRFVLTAEVVTADEGSVLVSRRVTARDMDDIINAVNELAKKLRERIGEPLRSIGRADPLERVTTGNLEALRKYSSAVRAIDVEGAPDRGIALLEEAVQLDSTFAMAWRKLGIALNNRGEERARIVEALTQAFENRDRLTARERDLATAAFYSNVAGDPNAAITAYETLLERNPDEGVALNNLGVSHLELRNERVAVDYFQRALAIDSTETIPFMNLIWTYANLGDFAAASQHIESYPWLIHDPTAKEHAAQLLASQGRYSEAASALMALRDEQVASPYWRTQTSFELGALAAVQGRLAEAERHFRDAMASNERRSLPRGYLVDATRLARLELWVHEDSPGALTVIDFALDRYPLEDLDPFDRPYLALAEVYALGGQPGYAQELLDRYEAEIPAELRPLPQRVAVDLVRGAIALGEGRGAEAVEATRAADRGTCLLCALPQLGRAYELAGQRDSAIAVYERYVETPWLFRARDTDGWYLAWVLERLGNLYEEAGETAKAADSFARLARLWAQAEDDLRPRAERARQRAARLRAGAR